MTEKKFTNALIGEKSPYLLQHAHNPVNWFPWNEDSINKAKKEDKLMLVSVGYSACHWCHVMEHECFQDEEVAKVMNDNFICIKVDREERPDIDQVYMSAVQMMTGHGGWPLNCFTLSNGKPLYGGTYFPKKDWINVMQNLVDIWKNKRAKALEYADELTNGLKHVEKLDFNKEENNFSIELLHHAVAKWKNSFDSEKGGLNRSPKFPMPNNWLFLLRYSHLTGKKEIEAFVNTTLQAMANGGIYDHAGGGFARYSTDADWKVPHFEKMLYDNAQLISLYAEAHRATGNPFYKKIAEETITFVEREFYCHSGGFYSALDADSEGQEGKFYVWKEDELRKIFNEYDYKLFAAVFSVDENGYWEDENYILLRSVPLSVVAMRNNLKIEELEVKIACWKSILVEERSKRVRPSLDAKILASWNALMIKAYTDAYAAFGNKTFKDKAVASLKFFIAAFENPQGGIFHSRKNDQSYVNGFLEDYAFAADAAIAVFLIDARQDWLDFALTLINFSFDKFYDDHTGMFYFTSSDDPALVIRKAEISDNVIPASNSVMARNLFLLYRITGSSHYRLCSERMLNNMKHELIPYVSAYSNWALLLMEMVSHPAELVITGENAEVKYHEFMKRYRPNVQAGFCTVESPFSIFKSRFVAGKTLFYVCRNQSCNLPVETIESVSKLLIE